MRVPRGSAGDCWQGQEESARTGRIVGLGLGKVGNEESFVSLGVLINTTSSA